MNTPISTPENRIPNGVCHYCGAPAVPFGCFCPVCYGAILHPEGLPMVPGDPDDPYRAFNAEADAGMADRKMPATTAMANAIDLNAYRRHTRGREYETTLTAFDPVTDARVRAVARPGESWEQARRRLEAANWACPPEAAPVDVDPALLGPMSNECLDDDFGQPIKWENGELGFWDFGSEPIGEEPSR